jgi:hypothetical protein
MSLEPLAGFLLSVGWDDHRFIGWQLKRINDVIVATSFVKRSQFLNVMTIKSKQKKMRMGMKITESLKRATVALLKGGQVAMSAVKEHESLWRRHSKHRLHKTTFLCRFPCSRLCEHAFPLSCDSVLKTSDASQRMHDVKHITQC